MLGKDLEAEICGVQVGSCPGRGVEGLGKVIGMTGLVARGPGLPPLTRSLSRWWQVKKT